MTLRYRPPVSSLSFDEIVNELCSALLEHELRVQSARRGGAHVPQFELDVLARKIARCEAWLRVMGKHTTLANVKARVAAQAQGDAPRGARVGAEPNADQRLPRHRGIQASLATA